MQPVPELVARWMARVRWFRWLDALVTLAGLWGISAAALGGLAGEAAGLALILVGHGFVVRPLRTRWRPLSGWVGLAMSRGLHPGDRAWYVRPHQADDLVLVTARHGARLVIARPNLAQDESLSGRRTRVLVLPADSA
jgi:hypothetical protein